MSFPAITAVAKKHEYGHDGFKSLAMKNTMNLLLDIKCAPDIRYFVRNKHLEEQSVKESCRWRNSILVKLIKVVVNFAF